MKTAAPRILLATLTLAFGVAHAQPGRLPGPPPGESLALVPGFDAAQVKEIRRIEAERRDAHDQLAIRQRGEHARIDDEAEQKLRQRLGDEGYRNYIRWKADSARPPRPGRGAEDGPLSRRDGPSSRTGRPDAAAPIATKPPES